MPVRLADYRPTDYAIATVALDVRLAPMQTLVVAELAVSRRAGITPGAPLTLAGDELELVAIAVDGRRLGPSDYRAAPGTLTLHRPPADPFTLRIETRIAPEANTKLMGLYRSSGNYCTQCEAEGFRRITYFLDRPDVLAVYTTRIEAEKAEAPYLLANGNRIEAGDIPGTDRHYAVWHDPFPKPSYLFALVAGDFGHIDDRFVTMSGREVKLEIYVEHGREERAHYAMDALKRSMRWDEEVFGREYDLDVFMIVAVSDFNMGAMENKGLNIFNDKYVLAQPTTATDADYANIEGVIAHEYFHNWTGNRITCRDWFQLCLKEGLTVFRDQEFSSDQRSRAVKRISDVRLLKSHQFPEDAGPLAHPVRPDTYNEINNFYTATVYEKGAEVVRMLKTLLGPEGFKAGMDTYFARHDGEAATVEDFVAAFAAACRRDLSQFMLWYHQSGTPQLTVRHAYDPASGTLTLAVEQSCPPTPGQSVKQPMHIPLALGLVGEAGSDLAPANVSGARVEMHDGGRLVVSITEPRHDIVFTGLKERPVPSLLRGFSAPVRLETDLDTPAQLFLLARDTDPFNRWQSAQTVSIDGLKRATRDIRAGLEAEIDEQLVAALLATAGNETLDPAFRALVLTLPGEAEIAREEGENVDPDAIRAARELLKRTVATAGAGLFAELHGKLSAGGPYRPDAAGAGRRALANVALDYVAATGTAAAFGTVEAAYEQADNMTDRLASLAILAAAAAPAAERALADFYRRFAGDALVIDKWFTVQATVPDANTLDRVIALTRHPAFSIGNPNRVRSLITAFATGNQTQFNRADGAGYRFVAERGIELDRRNPQVAARLISAFRSWRALEAGRRGHAEAALRSIAAVDKLSPDVADIVARCLA
ncbi:MAG: aminopeptidase N [Ancalomicrobiaceae bacterium]|nr:aminopeptidase N [Ancalomicrobiaceae bacterium]